MTRIRFEDLPSTNTPINAENLNKLNNVIVSSEEPTTGEEVWLQKGKNLFDKNNYNLFNGLIDDSSLTWYANANGTFVILEVKPNTTYTLSKKIAISEFAVASATDTPYIGMVVTKMISGSGKTEVSITTGENDKYLHIYVYYNTVSSGTLEEVLNSLEIEEGTSITPKKIHTKNDNGYEEFYNEEEREVYSEREVRIGTWIDDKPLYRQVFVYGELQTGALNHNIPNVEHIHFGAGTGAKRTDGFFAYNTYYNDNDFVMFLVNNQNVHFSIGSATRISGVTFVLEYTKTTD